jgi:hypothetical protein
VSARVILGRSARGSEPQHRRSTRARCPAGHGRPASCPRATRAVWVSTTSPSSLPVRRMPIGPVATNSPIPTTPARPQRGDRRSPCARRMRSSAAARRWSDPDEWFVADAIVHRESRKANSNRPIWATGCGYRYMPREEKNLRRYLSIA